MLLNLLSEINKAKKKYGDIPVIYMYDYAPEGSLDYIDQAKVAYTNLSLESGNFIHADNVKEENFVSVKMYNPEQYPDFKPVLFLMGKN